MTEQNDNSHEKLAVLRRVLSCWGRIYYIPGLAEGAPKRNVILLLMYLFGGVLLGNLLLMLL